MRDCCVSPKSRHGWLFCGVAAVLAMIMACWPVCVGAEPLHFTTAEVLNIEGQGFSPPPYSLEKINLQGPWSQVNLPHAVSPEFLPGVDDLRRPRTVVSWYRLQMPWQKDGPDNAFDPYYLYIPRWKTDGQLAVYVNGQLVYRSNGNLLWNGSNHPLWIPLDKTQSAALSDRIVLRIERLRATGAAVSSVWLGRQDEIGWRYRMRDVLQIQLPLMTSAAFLAVGLFALFVWLKQKLASRQPDWLYLLFFVMSLASFFAACISTSANSSCRCPTNGLAG